ncbi:hypothetical protein [Chitinophaga rhizosphaerae]|uniref:hypothetical protein n=1 Tax=Chitinophaga rhizosphaerae TaxID=1864947 RepID=UPI000F7FBB8F|nr:hypothetical protein [Chitinophaga rhizosphaerae]
MKKNVRKKGRTVHPKYILWFLFFVFVVGTLLFKIGKNQVANYFLNRDVLYTKGVIIDEKNYMGNSPVSHEFSYSYEFILNGKVYKNNSHNSKYLVGDSVNIKYSRNWPGFNKIADNQ